MYEDLEPIANLKIGKEVDAIAREGQAEQASTMEQMAHRGMVQSGNAIAAVMRIHIRNSERLCRAVADAWIDLIQRKNKCITREDIGFVMHQVETCAASRVASMSSIASKPAFRGLTSAANYANQEAARELQRITGAIRRDLEIEFREREAFPDEIAADPRFQLNIHNSNIANLNLGSQLGTITNALQVMSSGGEDQKHVAEALKQLTETIVSSSNVGDEQKKEIIQALSTIATEAEREPEKRSIGTIRAIASWLPTMLASAADAITIWDRLGPVIKARFGL
jgi:hypothetical protein